MVDYNTKKAQLLDFIENELTEEKEIRKEVLYYKAWKKFGFSEKVVDKAVERLISVGRASDDGLGVIHR